jgi:dihydrofolate reductase
MHLVVAVARNGVIGIEDRLPWHLKADLLRFKRLTMGHTLLMGRKTFASIGKPLPGRETIVLTRNPKAARESFAPASAPPRDLHFVDSIDQAIQIARIEKTLFVVGGADVYRQCLPYVQELHVTHVFADILGDATLDPLPYHRFDLKELELFPSDLENQWPTRYERWVKRETTGHEQETDSNGFSTGFGNTICS